MEKSVDIDQKQKAIIYQSRLMLMRVGRRRGTGGEEGVKLKAATFNSFRGRGTTCRSVRAAVNQYQTNDDQICCIILDLQGRLLCGWKLDTHTIRPSPSSTPRTVLPTTYNAELSRGLLLTPQIKTSRKIDLDASVARLRLGAGGEMWLTQGNS